MKKIKISASKISNFNVCPKKLEFQYVMGIPQDDHHYFETWKLTEELLVKLLTNKKIDVEYKDDIKKLAYSIYENKKFQELIKDKKLEFQHKYETDDIIGFSDIETDDTIIDIKTSSTKWNEKTLQEKKYQAMMYMKYSNKPNFYFVIVNKNTYEVQVIKINIKCFKPLEDKIHAVKLAFEMWIFPTAPGFHCKFCDYNKICDN